MIELMMQIIGGYLPKRYRTEKLGILHRIKKRIPLDKPPPCEIAEGTLIAQIKTLLRNSYLQKYKESWVAYEVSELTRSFLPSVILRQNMR